MNDDEPASALDVVCATIMGACVTAFVGFFVVIVALHPKTAASQRGEDDAGLALLIWLGFAATGALAIGGVLRALGVAPRAALVVGGAFGVLMSFGGWLLIAMFGGNNVGAFGG